MSSDRSSARITFADIDRCIHGQMRGLRCMSCEGGISVGNELVSDQFGVDLLKSLPLFTYSSLQP